MLSIIDVEVTLLPLTRKKNDFVLQHRGYQILAIYLIEGRGLEPHWKILQGYSTSYTQGLFLVLLRGPDVMLGIELESGPKQGK